ncbi:Thioredoxin domain-containing protein [Fusarium sp. LHS14.1]|nr:Thioredoxin domain-containing protein [Fusarium sp. LHS14.1]
MSVIELKSKAEFNELINKTPYVAIQAHATWCGPCKAISPFYNKHAEALAIPDKYAFAKFDTDDVPDLAFELGVRSIPAFYFFKNGDKDESLVGPIPPKLKTLVEGYSAEAKGEAGEKPAEEKPAEEATLKTDENF